MTRDFSLGKLPELAYKAHAVSIHIQQEIEAMAKPGTPCAELYNLSYRMAEQEGLSPYFMGTKQQAKFVGHGIGIQINELPVLTPRSKELLAPDMVFALEPKFVIPGVGAVGVENSYLVTGSGLEKLTLAEENMIQL
jgi:Xaa-Pro aminopeptidase